MAKYQFPIDEDFFDRLEGALGLERYTPYDDIIAAAAKTKAERDIYKDWDKASTRWYEEVLEMLELPPDSDDDDIRDRVDELTFLENGHLLACHKTNAKLDEIAAAFEALKAEAGKTGELVLALEKTIYG